MARKAGSKIGNYKTHSVDVDMVVYPLPTMIVNSVPSLNKHVLEITKLLGLKGSDKIDQMNFDLKLTSILEKIHQEAYSSGLKHMDRMHKEVNKCSKQ